MNFPFKPPFFLDFPVRYDKSPDGNGLFVQPNVVHGASWWFLLEHARLFSAAIPRKIHRNGLG